MNRIPEVDVMRSAIFDRVPHGFFGRRGGVSVGSTWGLNAGFGSNDERSAIVENRTRAADALIPGAPIVTVHQVHSPDCVIVDRPWGEDARPRADALVTDRSGFLIGILTADCAPVLLADAKAGVVGAAHAGWRGALGGVVDSTLDAMERLGASRDRVAAAVGPCIAQPSYEVDRAFQSRFVAEDAHNARFFTPGPRGKPHFDLQAYVVHRLIAAGAGEVESLKLDTYCDDQRFFSYRRSTHIGEADYGRQISLIGLPH